MEVTIAGGYREVRINGQGELCTPKSPVFLNADEWAQLAVVAEALAKLLRRSGQF